MLSSSGLIILTSSLIKAVTSNILFQSKETYETIKLDQRVPVSIYGKCYSDVCEIDKYYRKTGIWPVAQKFREHLDNHYKGILDVRTY